MFLSLVFFLIYIYIYIYPLLEKKKKGHCDCELYFNCALSQIFLDNKTRRLSEPRLFIFVLRGISLFFFFPGVLRTRKAVKPVLGDLDCGDLMARQAARLFFL